ncbi:hypothetical protein L9F63_016939 [Diploptera punctata]|uniref:C2HC/C3H-type domain-containing protein n=1 Tax=Diploptera punctata TaxID=6984 RepID=A0AAD7ZZS4_DIPPU|nr:hypothetical protein L9F63_016939 [Diploptera punctata]
MQEKEQKLLRLYESQTQRAFQRVGRGSAGSSSSSVSSTSSSLGGGKVRQLFQERRHQQIRPNGKSNNIPTGWDRSYPLEPLENNAKQRLQPSKSTGNLKIPRGTSLERTYSNNTSNNQYQARTQARRSKSQVRTNNQQSFVVDLGSSFRKLNNSEQQLYHDEDDVDYSRNHYRDADNNRIYIEREDREEREEHLFNNRNFDDEDDDIENEDPPFQQLDDDDDEDFQGNSQAFQKLPNVGRVQMESKSADVNNRDRYKTYTANSNGIRNKKLEDKRTPVNSTVVKEPVRRREQDVPVKASPPRVSPAAKKPEAKVNAYSASKTAAQRTSTPSKPDSARQNSSDPPSWERKSTPRKTASDNTEQQMIQRIPAARPAARASTVSAQKSGKGSAPRTPGSRPGPPAVSTDLAECKICGRNFAKDRITVHESICSKTSQKKRKIFDPTKQRVKGTGAEQFLKKGKAPTVTSEMSSRIILCKGPSDQTIKKTNWRQKHEDFINSIRAAKEMKVYLAKGGKLSDLPPPPPSDYSDYVQCPHCSRRFNQQAAERHIPKCATYAFNKPKPSGGGAGRGRGAVPKKR